jgi:hypothetical protein
VKTVKPDPNLIFSEHMGIYSARLFTYGYDIYYTRMMYLIRPCSASVLDGLGNHATNMRVCDGIFETTFPDSTLLMQDYPYGVGTKRRMRRWIEMINFDYVHGEPLVKGILDITPPNASISSSFAFK